MMHFEVESCKQSKFQRMEYMVPRSKQIFFVDSCVQVKCFFTILGIALNNPHVSHSNFLECLLILITIMHF
jgi:hypothetical protein